MPMMLPTHALIGLALAIPFVYGIPEFGSVALLAGFLGSILPDFDLYVGHRKTLHYPVYYSSIAIVAVPVALLTQTPVTVGAGVFLLAAAVHSVTDAMGGGLELRPWEGKSDRAVYDHCRNQWIAPRRWVRYDGAPEDLLIALIVAIPLLSGLKEPYQWLVFVSLGIAVIYSTVRRRLPTIADHLIADVLAPRLPQKILGLVPGRYLPENGRPPHRG